MELSKRFWDKINSGNTDDCWEWMGALFTNGYGHIGVNYRDCLAHRIAYELTYGQIPNGKLVLHTCDNRKCCNPSHLFLGTHQDNTSDMIKKQRKINISKLNAKEVVIIRELYASGNYFQKDIAKIFGVSQSNISFICRGISWKQVLF